MDSDGNPVPQAKFWGAVHQRLQVLPHWMTSVGQVVRAYIFLLSTLAGSFTIAVKDMNDDGTVNFMQTTDIVVDAADFAKL